MRHVTLPELILVAAAANAMPTDEILDGADLTLLVLITGRAREATTAVEAAAELLVGVAAGRPFPTGNRAAAWALAAHATSINRRRLDLTPAAVVALLDGVVAGAFNERFIASHLRRSITIRPSRIQRFMARMFEVPPAPPTTDWACPECGRTVPESPHRSSAFLYKPLPDDVIRDCAARHRAHGPVNSGSAVVMAPLRRSVVLRRA